MRLPWNHHLLLAVSILASLSSPATLASTLPRSRARAERAHTFSVARPLAESFIFFEPIGEKLWAEGWQPTFLSSADSILHEGSAFLVPALSPTGSPIEAAWTVSRYEPPHRIEYRNFLPGVRTTKITVQCVADGPDRTRVSVRYVYHAISDEGDAFVGQMTEEKFRAMIDSWQVAIAAYLRRGAPASP